MYNIYNHNNSLLGSFKTKKEAIKDMEEYIYQTGNAAYLVNTNEVEKQEENNLNK